MNLEYTHKPNYFLFAQLFIRYVENHIKKHPDQNEVIFSLREVFEIFKHDLASTTTNLEGILNISDEYKVETLDGDQKIIQSYKIHGDDNSLKLILNPSACQALADGQKIIEPDATMYL